MKKVSVQRETKETRIELSLGLGNEPGPISTGLPFFDHMLGAAAFHGRLGLSVSAQGDIDVDPHHLVEDVGIVLGTALLDWVTQEGPVARFAHEVIPMDDALSEVCIDASGRPYLVYRGALPQAYCGALDVAVFREFYQGLASYGRLNLHLEYRYGINSHHMVEAGFKALGRALGRAYAPLGSHVGPLSTKGSLV